MTNQAATYPPLVSVLTASEMLGGRGKAKIYDLIRNQKIDSVKDGKRRMCVTASIYEYIDTLEHSRDSSEDSN